MNEKSEIIISIRNLSKRFGKIVAVDDLNLDIFKGEIFGFLGPNGAGKTTTMNLICNLLDPDKGEILFNGRKKEKSDQTLKYKIGLCPQELVCWDYLTCQEQLIFTAEMYGLSRRNAVENTEKLIETLGLTDKKRKTAKTLSGGLKRRLNLALALVHDPEIVILDEPEAGLDPQSRLLVREYIKSLAPRKTVIFTTQNMDEADRICTRIGIIDRGNMLVSDTSENLKKSIGDGDVLEITLREITQIEKLRKALKVKLGDKLKDITAIENRLIIRTSDTTKNLPIIIQVLLVAQIPTDDIRFRWNTLEDVFIKLTGRSLRS